MPYNKQIRDLGLDQRLDVPEMVEAVFTDPGLHNFEDFLSEGSFEPGYPPVLMFGLVIATRGAQSQRALLAALKPELWEKVCGWYLELTLEPVLLPSRPPTARQLDLFRQKVCAIPGWSARLTELFIRVAVAQAKELGQFPKDVPRDWASPDPRCTIVGDGTFLDAYSNVIELRDEKTGELHTFGSRATVRPPRIQRVRTNDTEEHKHLTGVNYVLISTWTPVGWVVLGVDRALHSESPTAADLVYRVIMRVGEGVHSLVYDRVFQGRLSEQLLAHHQVLVINKMVARGSNFRGGGTRYTALAITEAEALTRFRDGKPLPIGASVYPTTKGLELVRSRYFRYATLRFPPHGRHRCEHHLWVDDGALVEVRLEDNHWWKVAMAVSDRAVPDLNADGGFDLVTTWRLTCPEGDHEVVTRWSTHMDDVDNRSLKARQRAEADLRPLPRLDVDRFRPWLGRRNMTESINAWIQGTFRHPGRAMRLSADQQFLDVIASAALANAVTNHREMRRDADHRP